MENDIVNNSYNITNEHENLLKQYIDKYENNNIKNNNNDKNNINNNIKNNDSLNNNIKNINTSSEEMKNVINLLRKLNYNNKLEAIERYQSPKPFLNMKKNKLNLENNEINIELIKDKYLNNNNYLNIANKYFNINIEPIKKIENKNNNILSTSLTNLNNLLNINDNSNSKNSNYIINEIERIKNKYFVQKDERNQEIENELKKIEMKLMEFRNKLLGTNQIYFSILPENKNDEKKIENNNLINNNIQNNSISNFNNSSNNNENNLSKNYSLPNYNNLNLTSLSNSKNSNKFNNTYNNFQNNNIQLNPLILSKLSSTNENNINNNNININNQSSSIQNELSFYKQNKLEANKVVKRILNKVEIEMDFNNDSFYTKEEKNKIKEIINKGRRRIFDNKLIDEVNLKDNSNLLNSYSLNYKEPPLNLFSNLKLLTFKEFCDKNF